ncbi:unnamed protein product [Alopecurus aequalis]
MDPTDRGDGMDTCFFLPYDILRRLPCRALAESRRVCHAWRDAVDAHNLQLPHFFPWDVFPGIFLKNYGYFIKSSFITLSAPCSGQPCRARVGPISRCRLFRYDWTSVLHHCNGLLLHDDRIDRHVCNLATVRCTRLPKPLDEPSLYNSDMFLAFDPAVSRHHEVFILPRGTTLPDMEEKIQPRKEQRTQPHGNLQANRMEINLVALHIPKLFKEEQLSDEDQEEIDTTKHFGHVGEFVTPPPSVLEEEPKDKVISTLVFSSKTDQWANRDFLSGRCAPGHLYDMVTAPHPSCVKIWKTVGYWQGSLYVHCWNNIVMILHNSEGTYDMAPLPGKACDDDRKYGGKPDLPKRTILVSYERGVHYVALDKLQLHVWTLTKSVDGQVDWVLAHEADLSPYDHWSWWKPKVPWEGTTNCKVLFSLFKIEQIIYGQLDSQSDTTDDVDGDDGHGEERGLDEDGHGELTTNEECLEYRWDSDEDNFIDDLDESAGHLGGEMLERYGIIGLHPHKDVIFLQTSQGIATYHFRTSRMQYLGKWLPDLSDRCIEAAFPYRPCYVDALRPGN